VKRAECWTPPAPACWEARTCKPSLSRGDRRRIRPQSRRIRFPMAREVRCWIKCHWKISTLSPKQRPIRMRRSTGTPFSGYKRWVSCSLCHRCEERPHRQLALECSFRRERLEATRVHIPVMADTATACRTQAAWGSRENGLPYGFDRPVQTVALADAIAANTGPSHGSGGRKL